ncbi:unnamed protein product [Cylicostephanus goldi]|uniref:HTH cro/C1-type domain-containing protein n=1 Tax=Cylicostephanus goldi TaxID=71465 RepID=A0A3P7QH58_CYLGO|nr:unnamed protein product [Cylicostephanus goldi]
MPDIAKLPDLAEILGVSVDELLGEKSALVEAALNNKVEEAIESKQVENYLMYMDDEDVRNLAFAALEKGENVEMFLPYMEEEDVSELAMKALKMQKRK